MANLKNTTITETGFLKVATGTTAQRPVSPTSGMTRYNTSLNQLEIYNGTTWQACIENHQAKYNLAIFDQFGSTTWPVPKGVNRVHVLVVGGGGGGGTRNAGAFSGGTDGGSGGGAGGFVEHFTYPVAPEGTVAVTVGRGGFGGGNGFGSGQTPGQQGQNSVFGDITAFGGGWGAAGPGNQPGNPGGSGGGAGGGGGAPGSGGTGRQGSRFEQTRTGCQFYGNPGGPNPNVAPYTGSGGGGAGGTGGLGGDGRLAPGGSGRASWITGGQVFYAGGGGGGGGFPSPTRGGNGGTGGGGDGGESPGRRGTGEGGAGITGTGGGGGGGAGSSWPDGRGGNGAPGIVIIRW